MNKEETMFEIGAKFDEGWSSDNRDGKRGEEPSGKRLPPERHRLSLSREKRRGKWITGAGPFHLQKEELRALLKTLKKELGCGGTLREDRLELQGDIGRTLRDALERRGYRFK
jgi:translation initiation factor 1